MKRLFERLKETWYGALPWILLVGVPTAICIIIAWKDITHLLSRLDEIYGFWLLGIILILFASVAAFNLFYGFITAVERISKKLSAKWAYTYFIVTILGIVALRLISK